MKKEKTIDISDLAGEYKPSEVGGLIKELDKRINLSEFPHYLGCDECDLIGRKIILEEDVISCFIYEPVESDDGRLKYKMLILNEDLFYDHSGALTKVYSRVDPGEHYKGECSLMVYAKEDGFIFLKGESYRGIILK